MILVKTHLINDEQLLVADDFGGNGNWSEGCEIKYLTGKGTAYTDIKSSDIYNAIEAKENLPKQKAAEIEALKKELKDTEALYLKAKKENENLHLQIKKLSSKATTCEFALVGKDGCIGNEDCPADCSRCEIYYKFCEPAVDDENGCNGIKDPSGATHQKCQRCPGWMMHIDRAGDPDRD